MKNLVEYAKNNPGKSAAAVVLLLAAVGVTVSPEALVTLFKILAIAVG